VFGHKRGMVGMAVQKKDMKERAASQRTPARTTTATTGRGGRTATAERMSQGEEHGPAVPVPVVMPRVKVMHIPLPTRGLSYVGDAGRVAAAYLPPPDRLAFYGGLGAAAVIGIIDWPVAAAIGIGTMVARRALGRRGSAQGARTVGARGAAERTGAEPTAGEPAATSRTATTRRAGSTGRAGTSRAGTTSRATSSRTGTRTATKSATAGESGTAGGAESATGGGSRSTGRSQSSQGV
jgi:hypothetical protein